MKYANCHLKNAEVCFEDGTPYLKLVYEYEDKKGTHELTFPRVQFPFSLNSPEVLFNDSPHPALRNVALALALHDDYAKICLYDTKSDDGMVYFTDKITKYKPQEMTLEEIEKKLGYKVKIVSDKKENNHA